MCRAYIVVDKPRKPFSRFDGRQGSETVRYFSIPIFSSFFKSRGRCLSRTQGGHARSELLALICSFPHSSFDGIAFRAAFRIQNIATRFIPRGRISIGLARIGVINYFRATEMKCHSIFKKKPGERPGSEVITKSIKLGSSSTTETSPTCFLYVNTHASRSGLYAAM